MFWADAIVKDILGSKNERIKKGDPLVIRDEKTASGRVHVGSMRGVAVHGIVSEVLTEASVPNTFLYEINDFDPMDGLPEYLDKEVYEKFMGQPLYTIPSPDGKAKNYAEYYGEEFIDVIEAAGFHPKFYRLYDLYAEGKMNDGIRLALLHADHIRKIYKDVSGSDKPADWMPLSVVCEKCGKIGTTKTISFDGEFVTYTCEPSMVKWAKGCGHKGQISPFNGNAKLPWKVEWAAKFLALGIDVEGAGKDHSTRGGARDVSDAIAREVFHIEPPHNLPYEFFLVGGKKMSSSKGRGSSAHDIASLIPSHIFRLALIGKNPKQAIDFDPEGDTIPLLYDLHDTLAEKYFAKAGDDQARLFQLIYGLDKGEIEKRFFPRFSQIAFLVQMPHLDIYEEVAKIKGSELTQGDREEIDSRSLYAKNWLSLHADEKFKFELQKETLPEGAKDFSKEQKTALQELLTYVEMHESLLGQDLHTALHEIKTKTGIEPKNLFSAIYISFLGKDHGPKAGWFLSVLPREFLLKRLQEVSS